jgi:hypothetical protein
LALTSYRAISSFLSSQFSSSIVFTPCRISSTSSKSRRRAFEKSSSSLGSNVVSPPRAGFEGSSRRRLQAWVSGEWPKRENKRSGSPARQYLVDNASANIHAEAGLLHSDKNKEIILNPMPSLLVNDPLNWTPRRKARAEHGSRLGG